MFFEPCEPRRLFTVVDFDLDGLGNPTTPGQIIDNEYANLGITITTNSPGSHPAMIFNSSAPTGGDVDLGSANEDFGGPGIGVGGEQGQPGENNTPQGRILIISEDGSTNDPDDNAGGGTIRFTFATAVKIVGLTLMDIEASETTVVRCFDSNGNLLSQTPALGLGDNSFQSLAIGTSGVSRMDVVGTGSLAIPNITVEPPNGEEHLEGRMTGGGSVFLGSNSVGAANVKTSAEGIRVTHGFELHCAEPSALVNNHLQINWGSPNQHFHLETLLEVDCSDNDIIQNPPDAPIDTMHGIGVGRFSGTFNGIKYQKAAARIEFTLTDGGPLKGEPGIFDTSDYHITVLDGNNNGVANDPVVVLDTSGALLLNHGNHQAHDELKNLTSDAQTVRTTINGTFAKMQDASVNQKKAISLANDLLLQFAQFETANQSATTSATSSFVQTSSGTLFSSSSSSTSLLDGLEPPTDPLWSL